MLQGLRKVGEHIARAALTAVLVCAFASVPLAWAASAIEIRAAEIYSLGYQGVRETQTNIPTTVGGTAVVSSALTGRARLCLYLLPDVTATLYISTGAPSATAHLVALTGGQQWCERLDDGITVKALSSSGTVSLKVSEFKGSL